MKKPKKTKKNLDDIIQRLEKQVKRLQDGGDQASTFLEETSLAPSAIFPNKNKRHRLQQGLPLLDDEQDNLQLDDEEDEGAKKRKVKERQKREADKAIDKRNQEEEEKRKKKKKSNTIDNKMVSGRVNAILKGQRVTKDVDS